MHFSDKKINMALHVKRHYSVNAFQHQYKGTVLAPAFMAGQEVRVNLSNYNAWQLRDCKSEAQALVSVKRMGYDDLNSFARDVQEDFQSMSIPGTIAMFQGCLPGEARDLWGCWVGAAVGSKPPNDAMHGYARLLVKELPGKTPRISADFLFPDRAVSIESLSDFVSFFEENLSPEYAGCENNANCLFRIRAKDSDKVVNFWAYVAREEVSFVDDAGRSRSFNIPAPLEKTWREAVIEGKQSAGLSRVVAVALGQPGVTLEKPEHAELARDIAKGLASGEIWIDAIPGQRHRLMGDVLKNISNPDSHINQSINKCKMMVGDKVEFGFFPMIGITHSTYPSSAKFLKNQSKTIVINRIFHDDGEGAVRAENIPVGV
jgi:hypothetical protein